MSGPRVAESIDDLHVGMWIAFESEGRWHSGLISQLRLVPGSGNQLIHLDPEVSQSTYTCINMNFYNVVILTEGSPVPISRELYERLKRAVGYSKEFTGWEWMQIVDVAMSITIEVDGDPRT